MRHYRRMLPSMCLAQIMASLLLATTSLGTTPATIVLPWLLLTWLLPIAGLRRWLKHRHRPPATVVQPRQIRKLVVTSLVGGLIWGSAGYLFYTPEFGVGQLVLIGITGGNPAAAVGAMAYVPAAALAFCIAHLGPLALRMAIEGGPEQFAFIALMALFLSFLAFIIRSTYRSFVERVEAELAINELNDKLAASADVLNEVLENISDGFVWFDADDRLVFCNEKFRNANPGTSDLLVPGARFEDLVQANIERRTVSVQPDEAEDWIGIRLAHHRTGLSNVEFQMEDGRWMMASDRRTAGGDYVGIRIDITEKKAIEQELRRARDELEQRVRDRTRELQESHDQLRLITDSVPATIAYLDRDKRFVFANKTCVEWSATSRPEIIGRRIDDAIRGQRDDMMARRLDIALSGQAVSFEDQIAYPDGRVRDVNGAYIPQIDIDGIVQGCVALIHDITEQKQVQRELTQAKESAEQADRMKSEFFANMSHELRTPLNAVIGFSEMLELGIYGDLNAKQRDTVGDIGARGKALLTIINDILDITSIEAGRLVLQEQNIDLRELIGEVCATARENPAAGGRVFDLTVDRDVGDFWADPRLIKQMLLKLISNAVKFTPEDGRIGIGAGRDDCGCVELVVTDTGIGMAEQDMPKAMSAFGQVDSTLTRKFEGAGLGLTLAKSFAELHGGALVIDSAVGKGTTVTVRFPAERSDGLPAALTAGS